jgi:hypothetical protein
MSFDVPDEDKYQRFLLNHPESDSLFEVFSMAEAKPMMNDGCDDVTDEKKWEELFKKEKTEKGEV